MAERLSSRLALGAPPAASPRPRADAPSQPTPAAPTGEQRQQLERARQLVSATLRSGVIRKDDIRELRRLHQGMGDPRAFEELRGELIRALNQGRLQPEDPHVVLP